MAVDSGPSVWLLEAVSFVTVALIPILHSLDGAALRFEPGALRGIGGGANMTVPVGRVPSNSGVFGVYLQVPGHRLRL